MTAAPDQADVLAERARALARPLEDGTAAETRRLLVMCIGATEVAVEIERVRDVRAPDHLTRVPGGGRLGFALRNLRGELVVVVDLAAVLGLVPAVAVDQRWVVVVDAPDGPLGMLVDRADSLVAADPAAVAPLPAHDEHLPTRLLQGVTADAVCVLDLAGVFASATLPEAEQSASGTHDQEGPL